MTPIQCINRPTHVLLVRTIVARALSCWNWKCALMSALARSVVYVAAMAHSRVDKGAVVLVEMVYVTLTAGVYAGLQQRALGIRSRLLGNFTVAFAVPVFAQVLDWAAHRVAGAASPARATIAVCSFAVISALFHLHVMRNGVFLTGGEGHSLAGDFQRIPRLLAGFVAKPFVLVANALTRPAAPFESDAAI